MRISAKLKKETKRAYLMIVDMVSPDCEGTGCVQFKTEVWLPKSMTVLINGGMSIPGWLAKSEGFAKPKQMGRYQVVSYAVEI